MNQQLPTGNILRVADLELNVDSKEVSRNGKSINLTSKKNFSCWNIYATVTGFFQEEIYGKVWDLDFDKKM